MRSRLRLALLGASLVTSLWALLLAAAPFLPVAEWATVSAEIVRGGAWLVFLAALLAQVQGGPRESSATIIPLALGVPLLAAVALAVKGPAAMVYGIDIPISPSVVLVLISVSALLMLENLYRNSDADGRWALKYLATGLGLFFVYDFFMVAEGLLFERLDQTLFSARGVVDAFAAPLVALAVARSRSWPVDVHVSRHLVFHSFALVGAGLYLLTMAGAGYALRAVGGSWGPEFQIVFLAGAGTILVILLASGSVRSRLRLFVSRNFYSAKYDYRQEWLRFIHIMSSEDDTLPMQQRMIRAITSLTDSTGAVLWTLSSRAEEYQPTASWSMGEGHPTESADSPLVRWLGSQDRALDLTRIHEATDASAGVIPSWLRTMRRAWLVVPLKHRDVLYGFVVLGTPRAERRIDEEDQDLLTAVGRQAASYLAEEQAADALRDARQLEMFHRRFAFVAHDLKNVVGQLSLMARNAERFGGDPEFQADLQRTLAHSVERMNNLLGRLKRREQPEGEESGDTEIFVGEMLDSVVQGFANRPTRVSLECSVPGLAVAAKRERLTSALGHLLENACEAAGDTGTVGVRAYADTGELVILIEDDGPGMAPGFVRERLFRPFNSTKRAGYGLGVYQAREYIREMGGRLEVDTALGRGTTMRVALPHGAADARANPSSAFSEMANG